VLAKQACRVFSGLKALLDEVLKYKYLSKRDFLDSFWGINPSCAWKSFFGGRG